MPVWSPTLLQPSTKVTGHARELESWCNNSRPKEQCPTGRGRAKGNSPRNARRLTKRPGDSVPWFRTAGGWCTEGGGMGPVTCHGQVSQANISKTHEPGTPADGQGHTFNKAGRGRADPSNNRTQTQQTRIQQSKAKVLTHKTKKHTHRQEEDN